MLARFHVDLFHSTMSWFTTAPWDDLTLRDDVRRAMLGS